MAQKYSKVADQALQMRNKKLDKEDQQLDAARDIIAGSDPTVRSQFEKLYPELKGNDIAYARFIVKGGKGVEALAKGYIQPTQYLEAAIAGEPMAARLAVMTQAERTGQPIEVVAKDMQDALTLSKNPALLLDTMKKAGVVNEKQFKDYNMRMMAGTAKDKEAIVKELASSIPALMQKKMIARVENDLESWTTIPGQPSLLADPIFGNIYQGMKTSLGRKPTLPEVSKLYLNQDGITNEERTARQVTLVQAYEAALSKANNGIFSSPMIQGELSDKSRKMKQTLTAQIVGDSLARKLGAAVGETFTGAQQFSVPNMMFNMGRDIINAEVETVDQFLNGLLGR
jgi:hypothetical protein